MVPIRDVLLLGRLRKQPKRTMLLSVLSGIKLDRSSPLLHVMENLVFTPVDLVLLVLIKRIQLIVPVCNRPERTKLFSILKLDLSFDRIPRGDGPESSEKYDPKKD